MGADHRVLDRRVLLPHGRPVARASTVCPKTFEKSWTADRPSIRSWRSGVEPVVGGAHVGEQGVAPDRRDLDGMQDGTEGRAGPPRHVGVPAVLVAADGRLLFEADEFRLVGIGRDERMDLELAEPAGEGDVLVRGQRLVPEEEHLELVEALRELVDDRVVERAAEVDAVDLGADGGPDWTDVERSKRETGQSVALGGQMGHRADL